MKNWNRFFLKKIQIFKQNEHNMLRKQFVIKQEHYLLIIYDETERYYLNHMFEVILFRF